MEPLYEHDCDACIFCGTLFEKDYYLCPDNPTGIGFTIIERSSSEGSDYYSYACWGKEADSYIQSRKPIMAVVYNEYIRNKGA